MPALVAPHLLHNSRVGRCHKLSQLHAIAFAMGTHDRLGGGACGTMLTDLTAGTSAPLISLSLSLIPSFSLSPIPSFSFTHSLASTSAALIRHTATHCNTLQHSATLCNTLQHTAPTDSSAKMGCAYVMMPGELVQRVVEACGSWPQGRAGQLEGVVRVLGGGNMRAEASCSSGP